MLPEVKKPGWNRPSPGDDMLCNNAVSGSSARFCLLSAPSDWSLLQHALMGGQEEIPQDWVVGVISSTLALFDHLIRSHQHVRWYRQADLLGRFQIDDQLKLFRLLDGYPPVSRLSKSCPRT